MTDDARVLEAQVKQLREEIKTYKRQLKQHPHPAPALPPSSPSSRDVFFSLAFEHGSDLLFQLDEKGQVAQISARSFGLLGVTPAEVQGRPFSSLLRDVDRPRWTCYQAAAADLAAPLVVGLLGSRGHICDAELRALPLRTGQKRVVGWAGLAQPLNTNDVQIERLREETRLASGLAHELNQPLTAIGTTARACVRLLEAKQSDPSELLEAIGQIARQAERTSEIIRSLRELMMQGKRHRSRVDLNDIVREAIELLAADLKAAHIKVKLQLAPDLPTVVVDHVQIGQVLVNLARNALEAMLQGPAAHRQLTVTTRIEAGEVVAAVSDRGTGLSIAVIERLFEPFATTKPNGMGMGLALSRNIVQAHAGRLWANPNDDRGMTFAFSLPTTDEKADTP